MNKQKTLSKFENLTFEKFREFATDTSLSKHEKVGFPDSYREGKEKDIFQDICSKLANLATNQKTVLEIGPGCSELPIMMAKLCEKNNNELIFVDSQEMLSLLPKYDHVKEYYGAFPDALGEDFGKWINKIDVIVVYSVIQYAFSEGNLWDFVDRCLYLLADNGEILFGDIPNISMRKRFFSSEAGITLHQQFTNSTESPKVIFNTLEIGQMDDSVVFAILARARAQGFHAWVLPQSPLLPMSNRREDILIRKP